MTEDEIIEKENRVKAENTLFGHQNTEMNLGPKKHYEVYFFPSNNVDEPRILTDFYSLEEAEFWVREKRDRYHGDLEIVRETVLRQRMMKGAETE